MKFSLLLVFIYLLLINNSSAVVVDRSPVLEFSVIDVPSEFEYVIAYADNINIEVFDNGIIHYDIQFQAAPIKDLTIPDLTPNMIFLSKNKSFTIENVKVDELEDPVYSFVEEGTFVCLSNNCNRFGKEVAKRYHSGYVKAILWKLRADKSYTVKFDINVNRRLNLGYNNLSLSIVSPFNRIIVKKLTVKFPENFKNVNSKIEIIPYTEDKNLSYLDMSRLEDYIHKTESPEKTYYLQNSNDGLVMPIDKHILIGGYPSLRINLDFRHKNYISQIYEKYKNLIVENIISTIVIALISIFFIILIAWLFFKIPPKKVIEKIFKKKLEDAGINEDKMK